MTNPLLTAAVEVAKMLWWFPLVILALKAVKSAITKKSKLDGR